MTAIRGVARAIVIATAAGAVLVIAGYRWGAEHHWLLALIQYLPFHLHLAPTLLALLAALLLGRAWRVAALATVAGVAWGVMGLQLPAPDAAAGRIRLRVLTYNIKAASAAAEAGGFARLAREIERHDPDLVVLQEAGQPSARHTVETVSVASLLGPRRHQAIGQFVVASRYPLLGCRAAVLPPDVPGDAYARCTISLGGQAVDVYAVHLQTPRSGLDAARRHAFEGVGVWQENVRERLVQARTLAQDIAQAMARGPRPAIVAGDFNAPDSSLVMRALRDTGLRDAFGVAGLGYGYTYGQVLWPWVPFLRIDHVLASPEIGVAAAFAGGLDASPHRPVIADLLVPAAAPGADPPTPAF